MQVVDDQLALWAEVDTEAADYYYTIKMYFTGMDVVSDEEIYISTVVYRGLVLHFYFLPV